jgi:hypothetical protein
MTCKTLRQNIGKYRTKGIACCKKFLCNLEHFLMARCITNKVDSYLAEIRKHDGVGSSMFEDR